MKIAWIGLGKLGLPCATVISQKFTVVGYDIDIGIEAPFRIADTIEDCIYGADWIFVSVPTPHDPKYGGSYPTSKLPPKDFDYAIVKYVLSSINAYKLPTQQVVLVSTVLPGTTRRELSPIIPDLIYNPYLIAIGTVADDFIRPDISIIGSNNNSNVDALIRFYENFYEKPVTQSIGTWEEAELTKIMYNVYSTVKINFVNTVHDIAKRIGYANTDTVIDSLFRKSSRLTSPDYMSKPGTGIAGPCHPRDVIAMNWLSRELELGYDTFNDMMHIREVQAKNTAEFLCSYALPVCIVGLGYKKNLALTEGSYSLLVMHYLSKITSDFFAHDPLHEADFEPDQPTVYYISQHHDFVKDMTFFPGSIIVDPWRMNLSIPDCTVINI